MLLSSVFLAIIFLSGFQKAVSNSNHLQQSKKPETSTITGYAHGFKDGVWLFLDDAEKLGIAIDSVRVIDERFLFKIKIHSSSNPGQYAVRTKNFSDYKLFWMENTPLTFSGVKGNFRNAVIDGSFFQRTTEAFERITLPIEKEIDSLRRNFGLDDSAIAKQVYMLEEIQKNKSVQFIETNASSIAAAYLLSIYCRQWGRKISDDLYQKLTAVSKQSVYGQKVKRFILLNKQMEIGSLFTDFTLPDTAGIPIRLSSFKGNYVLLEFWASWCAPCRRENPNLVAQYHKYKKKGFEIVGVSNDISASQWKKAIVHDQLAWPNISALKGSDYDVAMIYGVYEIPANFLIAPDGRIIAKNIRGGELIIKLKQIFGE